MHSHRARRLAGLTTLAATFTASAVLVSLLTGSAAAGPSAQEEPPVALRASAGDLVVLSGQVSGTNTEATTLLVELFPVLPEGQRFFKRGQTLYLQSLVADIQPDGTYEVRSTSQDLLGYVDQFGLMNLTMTLTDGSAAQTVTASTRLASQEALKSDAGRARISPAGRTLAARATGDHVGVADFNLSSGTVSLDLLDFPNTLDVAVTDAVPADTLARRGSGCGLQPGKKHPDRPERFMYADNWKGAPMTFSQTKGASHTTGIGFKADGKGWTAKADASKTVGSSKTRIQKNKVQKWARNRVDYQDFRFSNCSGQGYTTREAISMRTVLDTPGKGARPIVTIRGCEKFGANETWIQDNYENITVAGGVDIGPINVSAQSGFHEGSFWKVKTTKRGRLCYNNIKGSANSSYVKFVPPKKRGGSCRPVAGRACVN